ncbi:MAG: hypothetical protein AB7O57_21980 [Hyphomicrobiaceae bacterium]
MTEAPDTMPGGGRYGRSAKREVRNPVLALRSARAIQGLPLDQRRPLGVLLRELAVEAEGQAQVAWRRRKGIMAAYWRAVATYAKHLARAIDAKNAR